MDIPLINPFEFYSRFPHIAEQVFEQMDNKSLVNCREVSKTWMKFIDERNFSWIRIINFPKVLKAGDTYLHLAAKLSRSNGGAAR